MVKKILFDEQGLRPGTLFEKGQWKEIASHTNLEIKGFFGDYRFLSNFWPANIEFEGAMYSCVENAYQAAKYPKSIREYFQTCLAKEAIIYVRDHPLEAQQVELWDAKKLDVMLHLLMQKFDKKIHPGLYDQLQKTKGTYLEETKYWGDIYWGVTKHARDEAGIGENNLGKLLMQIRDTSR